MGHRVWDQVVTLNVGFMERLRCSALVTLHDIVERKAAFPKLLFKRR